MGGIGLEKIAKARKMIVNAERVWVIGNGGSAAQAAHLAQDLALFGRIKAMGLVDNVWLSAAGNDFGQSRIFSSQLERCGNPLEDLLIAISTSGDSPNIVEGVGWWKAEKGRAIGLTGGKGRLREIVDLSLEIDSEDTGVIQNGHSVMGHLLANSFQLGRQI